MQDTYCPNHPKTATNLRCGKCEELICAKCMVHTPVGARCKSCAQVRRPPTYDISRTHAARAVGTGIGIGIAGGIALILIHALLPLGLFFYAIVAAGLGYVVSEGVSASANRKKGRTLQIIAAASVAIAFAIFLAGTRVSPFDWLAAGAGVYVAWVRLR